MGTSSPNSGTWSVMGTEHPNGREWGYRYHLGMTHDISPGYTGRTLRNAVLAAASQSESAWLAALPVAVRVWVASYPADSRAAWRDQDADP
jgi:hypothetical protein